MSSVFEIAVEALLWYLCSLSTGVLCERADRDTFVSAKNDVSLDSQCKASHVLPRYDRLHVKSDLRSAEQERNKKHVTRSLIRRNHIIHSCGQTT